MTEESEKDMGIDLKMHGLADFMGAFEGALPEARIGIFGDKAHRSNGDATNVEIGAVHEFGSFKRGLPIRSFLRAPLSLHLDEYLSRSGAFDEDVVKEVIQSKSILSWVQKVAIIAENVVRDAFDTRGFGLWKPSDMTRKKNKQTLVETQQLRDSISSEVKAK